jgi:hypothetical protein
LDPLGGDADRGDAGFARDGTGSLFTTVASIIDELTSSTDQAIRATDARTPCLGFACGSANDATEDRTLLTVLICLAIAFGGVLVVRARGRRSRAGSPSDRP